MKKIALSSIAALVLSVGVFQAVLAMGGSVEVAAAAVAFVVAFVVVVAAAAVVAAFDAAAVVAFVAAAAVVAFVAVAAFAVVVAEQESVPVKWAMIVYGIEMAGIFSAIVMTIPMFSQAISLAIVLAGSVAILGVWKLYTLRQIKAATA